MRHGRSARCRPDRETARGTRVRAAVGPATPILVSLDLHANVSPQMLWADFLSSYRTYPHTDWGAAGGRCAEWLDRVSACGDAIDAAAPLILIGGGARGTAWRQTIRRLSGRAVLAAQREAIRASFHGRRSAYLAALRQAHATAGIALSVLGDEVRRARLEQSRSAPKPTGSEVEAFYAAYPDLLVRRVHASPAPPWLGRRTGFAVSESALQRLFSLPTGRKFRLSTLLGTFAVRPLGPPQSLGSLPLSKVRSAQSFERWTIRQQTHALSRTICLHDQLPQPAAIDLTEYLPFLRIQ